MIKQSKMSVRELMLVLEKLPKEALLTYSGGLNEQSFQPVLRIEIPFEATKKS